MINVLGIDEAGRGAWAGPVVAAAVFWTGRCPIKNRLGDSKILSPKERKATYEEMLLLAKKGTISLGVGIIDNDSIDRVGIREANRQAMQAALFQIYDQEYIKNKTQIRIMIDGRDKYSFDIPQLPKPEYIVRGDSRIKQIMAASIVAKVTRDTLMQDIEKEFPGYGFAQHKGYGTAFHQQALQKFGVCSIHRKSYKPVSIFLS